VKTTMPKFSAVLFVLLWTVIAVGYQPDPFRVHVQFDNVSKLQEGNGVVLKTETIGFVESLGYVKEGYFKVTLAIDNDRKSVISEYTRFIIVEDPLAADKKAVRLIQTRRGGKLLKNGATVEGSDKYSVLFEDMTGDIRDGVDFLKKGMNEFSEEIKNLSENEQMKALRREIRRLSESMVKAKKETQEKIKNEILPLLKRDMEKLREQLRKFGREEEMEPLDNEMKKISHI
jgi:ABC-type transporter Mla subunit MlaD